MTLIDTEQEIVEILANEICKEVDREAMFTVIRYFYQIDVKDDFIVIGDHLSYKVFGQGEKYNHFLAWLNECAITRLPPNSKDEIVVWYRWEFAREHDAAMMRLTFGDNVRSGV